MLTHVDGVALQRLDHLSRTRIAAIRALIDRCVAADGVNPLNEEALFGLQGAGRSHLLLDEGTAGYATIADGTVQLMIDPVRRRAGLGAGLADAAGAAADEAGVPIRGWWAFGDLPGARALAARRDLAPVRRLLKLGRTLDGLSTPRALPEHARLRAFEPGRDETGWLAVNARAFANHPEQGRMTNADLAARMAEDWFDPEGLLLAVDADDPDRVLGFHWTKITDEDPATGEVYVLGVDPDNAGGGLGGALLGAGLAHLVARGARTVDLYVEGDNEPALGLYRRAGFDELARDVMYAPRSAPVINIDTDNPTELAPYTATAPDTAVGPQQPTDPDPLTSPEQSTSSEPMTSNVPARGRYLDRELSWLNFNNRVLDLAQDRLRVPLLERARFLAIFASNLDEFYMVRVAGLKRRITAGVAVPGASGRMPREVHEQILERTAELAQTHARLFEDVIQPELAEHGIAILRFTELTVAETAKMRQLFAERIFPVLTPLAVDPSHPFPYISGLSINLAVLVKNPHTGARQFARIKVPTVLPRFIPLSEGRFVPLEDVIAHHLDQVFAGMQVLSHHVFRVTRNEDVEVEEDDAENLLFALEKELLRRKVGRPPVRLEVEDDIDERMLELLVGELDISDAEVFRLPGPLDLRGLFSVADLDRAELKYPAFLPITHPDLAEVETAKPADLFAAVKQRDVLLHHPYDSFATSVQRFIEQAAADPHVLAIKQTLYRTSGDSPIVDALVEAAEAGKQVLVLVEIKARFDERANIAWARKLEQAGCHVVYGVVGLKTHCKLALVVREEPEGLRRYVHVGTGNYNPKTARHYEDMGVLTANPVVTEDIARLFNRLSGMTVDTEYRRLLVSPNGIRDGLMERIATEIEHHKQGLPARIRFKVNALVDEQITEALYEASQAGVPVDLWIRGTCSLRPGVPDMSENIQVRSTLGRFLEHSRLFWFANGGEPTVGIGSADMMHRNLDRRVETVVSITNPRHIDQIDWLFDTAFDEGTAAWLLDGNGDWEMRVADADGEPLVDIQQLLIDRLARRDRGRSAPVATD